MNFLSPRAESIKARIFLFSILIMAPLFFFAADSPAGERPFAKTATDGETAGKKPVPERPGVPENKTGPNGGAAERPAFLKGVEDTAEIIARIRAEIAKDAKTVDRQVESLLSRLMNSPEFLGADFSASTLDESRYSASYSTISVAIRGASFDGLRIDTASIVFINPDIDILRLFRDSRLKLISQNEIRARISVLEGDLNRYLAVKSEKIKVKRPYARFENDLLVIGGTFRYGILVISFSAAGRFRIEEGTKVLFDIRSLSVNSMKMNRAFLRKVVEKINPLIDLEKFPFKLVLKSIGINDGRLVFATD